MTITAQLAAQPLALLVALFVVAGALVWLAGTRLTALVDAFAESTGLGRAFVGMLMLGGITSLPEVATVATASATGNPVLALNNLLGSAAINLLLLAIADRFHGDDALTSRAGKPATLIQGALGMTLMAGVTIACVTGDVALPYLGVGLGSVLLALGCVHALRIAARFERAHVWVVVDHPADDPAANDPDPRPRWLLVLLILLAALVILAAGSVLSLTGDAIAERSGISDSLVGFALVGLATSLPELSSISAALRLRRYELAIGDIFGTNLFNILLILLADAVYRGGPVLSAVGLFEAVASALATLMTGIFVIGLLERRNRTIFRMGRDSALVMVAFVGGLGLLAGLA